VSFTVFEKIQPQVPRNAVSAPSLRDTLGSGLYTATHLNELRNKRLTDVLK
jgi:hypothetical protein